MGVLRKTKSPSERVPFVVLLALEEEDGCGRTGACCHTPAVAVAAGRGSVYVHVGEGDHEKNEEEAVQDNGAAVVAKGRRLPLGKGVYADAGVRSHLVMTKMRKNHSKDVGKDGSAGHDKAGADHDGVVLE